MGATIVRLRIDLEIPHPPYTTYEILIRVQANVSPLAHIVPKSTKMCKRTTAVCIFFNFFSQLLSLSSLCVRTASDTSTHFLTHINWTDINARLYSIYYECIWTHHFISSRLLKISVKHLILHVLQPFVHFLLFSLYCFSRLCTYTMYKWVKCRNNIQYICWLAARAYGRRQESDVIETKFHKFIRQRSWIDVHTPHTHTYIDIRSSKERRVRHHLHFYEWKRWHFCRPYLDESSSKIQYETQIDFVLTHVVFQFFFLLKFIQMCFLNSPWLSPVDTRSVCCQCCANIYAACRMRMMDIGYLHTTHCQHSASFCFLNSVKHFVAPMRITTNVMKFFENENEATPLTMAIIHRRMMESQCAEPVAVFFVMQIKLCKLLFFNLDESHKHPNPTHTRRMCFENFRFNFSQTMALGRWRV